MSICAQWATEDDLCAPCLGAYDTDYGEMDGYLLQASELLYMLSGQQFNGLCETTVRPCRQEIYNPISRHSLSPWEPFPWSVCGCHSYDSCSCARESAIELPHAPIVEVTEVVIDGDVLDDSAYELRGNLLVRTDGVQWPCCGDWTIIYTYGRLPPSSGVTAAAVLACELLMACDPGAVPGGKCRLPTNVSSISRQGVSVIFASLTGQSKKFRFGIWEIDLYLEAYQSAPESFIGSPDTIGRFQQVT